MSVGESEIPAIWRNLATALGAEAREYPKVIGASGLEHQFISLGIDEALRRLILVSADPDPRLAALVQSDIQSALGDYRVLVVRPVALDLSYIARELVSLLGTRRLSMKELTKRLEGTDKLPAAKRQDAINQIIGVGLVRVAEAFNHVQLPVPAQLVTVIQQAADLDWSKLLLGEKDGTADDLVIELDGLLKTDNMEIDRRYGVCPLPLYELSKDDWNLFNSADDIAAIRERLRALRVYQYFFPSADELAIGFVERGLHVPNDIESRVQRASALGHIVSSPSLVKPTDDFRRLLGELREHGYLVNDVEAGFEMGPEGTKYRMNVRSRPQEGIFARVLKRSTEIANLVKPLLPG